MKSFSETLSEEIDSNLIPNLIKFVEIPNQSRAFDSEWKTNGLMEKACNFCIDWARKQDLKDLHLELIQEPERTSLVYGSIPGSSPDQKTVLLYGHIDKQPPLTENWFEGLHPYKPVIKDNKLYGRGGADDGYAFFASILIAKSLQKANKKHPKMIFFFETDEESGSADIIHYFQKLKEKIGHVDMIFCLDSGTSDYEHLSLTTTLRGVLNFNMKVEVTKEGVHSGDASGVIPDSFRIGRHLLEQFENSKDGSLPQELYVNIPQKNYKMSQDYIETIKKRDQKFPFLEGVQKMGDDEFKLYLNNIWKPTLTVIGIDGVPSTANAGNVLRPSTTFGLSVRLPPTLNAQFAENFVKQFFEKATKLYNAKVTLDKFHGGNGFKCVDYSDNVYKYIHESAQDHFGKEPLFVGQGGSIPFLNDIQSFYPQAEFIVAGVLGPESNAHGPNEFIHIPYLKKLVCAFADLLAKF